MDDISYRIVERGKQKLRSRLSYVGNCLAGIMGLLVLAGSGVAQSNKTPIRIGALHNVTGSLGSIGQPSLDGALLAAKQLNERGGVLGRPVELVARDGRSDPAVVAASTRELVRMPHMAAITGLNDTEMALAAAPVAEKARMVFLTSGATSPKVPLEFPRFYFMTCFGDNTQAAAGAEYAHGALGLKTAWLLFDDTTDFTVLLAGYFKERYTALGGQILGEDTYAGGMLDFSQQIDRVLALPTPPDMLYVSAGPDDIGRLIKQMREAGLDQPIFGGDGYDTPLLLDTAGAAAHDTYFTTHVFLDPSQAPPWCGSSSRTMKPSTAFLQTPPLRHSPTMRSCLSRAPSSARARPSRRRSPMPSSLPTGFQALPARSVSPRERIYQKRK